MKVELNAEGEWNFPDAKREFTFSWEPDSWLFGLWVGFHPFEIMIGFAAIRISYQLMVDMEETDG